MDIQTSEKQEHARTHLRTVFYYFVYYWYLTVMVANRIRKGEFLHGRVANSTTRKCIGGFGVACFFHIFGLALFPAVIYVLMRDTATARWFSNHRTLEIQQTGI